MIKWDCVGATSKVANAVPSDSNQRGNADNREKTEGHSNRVQANKRKRDTHDQGLQGHAKAQVAEPVSNKDEQLDEPAGKIVLPQILTRTESVAGDNGTPKGDNNAAPPPSKLPCFRDLTCVENNHCCGLSI